MVGPNPYFKGEGQKEFTRSETATMSQQHFDVLIIGAGVSGIGMACHLKRECPGKSFAILERRQSLGGTWDLFRYPGIRSDSDMFTFGYNFRPWTGGKVLADGASIKNYVKETAEENGVDKHIQYGLAEALHPVDSATTLRVRDGEVLMSDGPFAETKEQLAGFYLLEARDLNEALQLASHIPPARLGSVEVRPVRDLPPKD